MLTTDGLKAKFTMFTFTVFATAFTVLSVAAGAAVFVTAAGVDFSVGEVVSAGAAVVFC